MSTDSIRGAAVLLAQLYRDIAPDLRLALRLRYSISLNHQCPVTAPEHLLPSITDGWAAFLVQVKEAGRLTVSRENCATSIYPQPNDNLWFRFVHDMGHLLYQCEFDYAGETELHRRLWAWIETTPLFWSLTREEQRWVWLVYLADTQGQTDYYEEHGSFPVDQAAFVIDCATTYYKDHFGDAHETA